MIAKKNILIVSKLKKSSLQVSLQSCQLSTLTCLQDQVALFAGSFAKISTLIRQFNLHRLRIQSSIIAFANGKPLISNGFSAYRLRHRLQICQLSPSTCLQVQAVSFASFKEQFIEKQFISTIFFASFFAKISN